MFNFKDKINSDEYVYLGCQAGKFQDESGRTMNYKHIFVLNSPADSENRSVFGYSSQKLKISDIHLCDKLVPGQIIKLYFDQYGRVCTVFTV